MGSIGVHGGASSGGGGGGAVTVADGADVAEGATTDAAVTTDVAGTISAKLRGLLKILDRMIGLESDTATKSYSLQIGGAQSPGGEWHAATTTSTQPASNAVGLVVRDPSALSVNSGALNTTGYGINAYSRSDSLVHSVESRDSKPLGTEYGLLTRNIYDTQISQLHNTIANPTRSLQLGGANTDGGTHRHVGASNAEPGASDVGLFVRNISGMGTPGSAVIGQVNVVAGRDPNTNVVRQIEVLPSTPAGTEGGVITRNIPIKAATSAVTSVADAAANQTLLAANVARLGATIHNDSTVILYLKLGATASLTSFTVKMAADSYYEVPFSYVGIIDGIWASDAAGSARITELTA